MVNSVTVPQHTEITPAVQPAFAALCSGTPPAPSGLITGPVDQPGAEGARPGGR